MRYEKEAGRQPTLIDARRTLVVSELLASGRVDLEARLLSLALRLLVLNEHHLGIAILDVEQVVVRLRLRYSVHDVRVQR